VGILGGTFNPPHRGHLALAEQAREQLGLERVLLVPARLSPHKPSAGEGDPGPAHRLAMCELAVAAHRGLAVCPLELERPAPSYTVDTLSAIQASHPDVHLTFILGADVAGTLPSWHRPGRLLELADLAVASRNGSDRAPVLAAIAAIGGSRALGGEATGGGSVIFIDLEPIDASSSLVRERVAAGKPIDRLVGVPVARYIAEHGLYGARSMDGS
jgi:nicotinate-nucleotide adenylyltransferase